MVFWQNQVEEIFVVNCLWVFACAVVDEPVGICWADFYGVLFEKFLEAVVCNPVGVGFARDALECDVGLEVLLLG